MCGVESYVVVILSRYLVDQNISIKFNCFVLPSNSFGADLFLVICGNKYISCNILPFLARCGVKVQCILAHLWKKTNHWVLKYTIFLESWYGYTMVQNLKKCDYFFIDEWAGRMVANRMKKIYISWIFSFLKYFSIFRWALG